jgi:putative nucleotidyltransferase with HDIG domain
MLTGLLSGRGALAELPFDDAIKRCGFEHVSVRERVDDDRDPRARARATYEESLGVVVELLSELRLGRIPTSTRASLVIDTMRDLILTDESALLALTQLKSYDNYTYNHSVNVGIFSLAFAKHLGLEGDAMRKVGLAGLLHDVGKVRTAEEIIKKPGALTPEEMEKMQRHPELGAEILRHMKGIDGETAEIVLHHHLRFDGTGYPALAPGRAVHPHGAVVALADCYDALTTTRPYQKSRHPSDAVRIMRRLSGKAYAPEVVQSFVDMLGTYPVGELVRLSSNELAVVTATNAVDATTGCVKLVTDAEGRMLPEPVDCDLSREPAGGRVIVASVDPLRKGIDVAKVLGL